MILIFIKKQEILTLNKMHNLFLYVLQKDNFYKYNFSKPKYLFNNYNSLNKYIKNETNHFI